jgi:hypothetical protein
MEQTQTQVCLGVLGDKRPTQWRAVRCVSEGEEGRIAWNKTAQDGALSGEKVGRKLSAQLFQTSLFINPKHALDGIFHKGYICA